MRHPRVNLSCENCQRLFSRPPSNIRNIKHYFCSRNCSSLWHKGKKVNFNPKSLENLITGKDFWDLASESKKEEARQKMRIWQRENNPNKADKHWKWKGGVSKINKVIRASWQYVEWRRKVFERDNYTCQDCGARGVYLEADHIKPFAYFPDLRFELNNGRTLCLPCHRQTDTYMGKAIKLYAK